MGVATDVTDRRQLEQRLGRAERAQAIGQLAGGIAHDFNNLLTGIIGHVALLQEEPGLSALAREDLAQIQRSADRAASLTRQLLAFSRRQVLAPRVLDLNQLVAGCLSTLRRLVGTRIQVVWAPASHLDAIVADSNQLEHVLTQLTTNARESMPDGGTLELSTRQEPLDGPPPDPACGPAPRDLRGPAGPGHRARHGRRRRSSGSSSHSSAPSWRARARGSASRASTASSSRAEGTSTSRASPVAAPRSRSTSRGTRGATPWAAGVGGWEAFGGEETILLVEDEEQVRELARRVLERVGYTVLAAADSETAIALADRHAGHIHLLVADMMLPQSGGRELAARLSIHRPAIKVLYISGTSDAIHRPPPAGRAGDRVPGEALLPRPAAAHGAPRPGRSRRRGAAGVSRPSPVPDPIPAPPPDAYRALFEHNPMPMWVYDRETLAFLEVNAAAVEHYGYSRDEFRRMSILDIRPEEDRAQAARRASSLAGDLHVGTAPWRHRRKDGSICLVRVSSHPISFAGREARLVVVQDVTEITRTAEELRDSREQYRFFIGRTAEGVWRAAVEPPIPVGTDEADQVARCTRHARLVEVNESMVRMYGCADGKELLGTQLSATFDLTDPRSLEFFRAFVRSGYRTVELESREFDRHGAERWFVNNLLGVVEDGLLTAIWGTQRDVTERRAAEELVRATREQLEALVEAPRSRSWRSRPRARC